MLIVGGYLEDSKISYEICKNDVDLYPAVTELNGNLICISCLTRIHLSRHRNELPTESSFSTILELIEVFAFSKFAKSFDHLLAKAYSRNLNLNLNI